MAQKPYIKIQSLADAYFKVLEALKGDVKPDSDILKGDDNTRHQRSCSAHPVVSTNPSPKLFSSPGSKNHELRAQMATITIKLLPTFGLIRAFSGTDTDYSAQEFIRRCEDVMTNFLVTDEWYKSAFVRSYMYLDHVHIK